jgi:hypothetical protein
MLALVVVGSIVAFVYTPQLIGHPPVFFVYNLRYAAVGLMLGLVLLPVVPVAITGRRPLWLGVGLLLVLAATQLDSTIWPTELFTDRFAQPIRGTDSLIGLIVGLTVFAVGMAVLLIHRRASQRLPLSVVIATAGLMLVAGIPLQQAYLNGRYANLQPGTYGSPRTVAWAQHLHDARIALVGFATVQQYAYYGKDLSNYVQYVEQVAPNGRLSPYPDCADWRRALHAGRYTYLFTASAPEFVWTKADPEARLISVEALGRGYLTISVFRLGDQLDFTGCA